MNIEGSLVSLSVDETIKFAHELLKSALLVKEKQKKLPDSYFYVPFFGFNPTTKATEIVRFRIGDNY